MKIMKIMMIAAFISAMFIPVTASADTKGFIYGKVITRSGEEYQGTLRWGKQECFWDDIFNATKDDNPWLRHVDDQFPKLRERRKEHDFFGIKVIEQFGFAGAHLFISRFGDLKEIKIRSKGRSTVIMKNGTEFDLTGSGDIGESIVLLDEKLGTVKLKWANIKSIEFMDTPKKAVTEGYRLSGKVKTVEMDFEGFVMWDAEECKSSDVLDGDTDDGDMEIKFGHIRSIKRDGRRGSLVTLKDGREFRLHGSNDVNSENRGIFVQDARYGKIEVQWDEFREVIYTDSEDSGDDYASYKPKEHLEGTVKTLNGKSMSGIIVYDLDESEGYEILNGRIDDMEFYIPFATIKSIQPKGRHSSIVKLRNGQELRLEDSQDVDENHDGLLIFKDKGSPEYIEWDDVDLIEFK